mmetsp:Transcript_22801/g.77635  ORF Transcript_22801/g.77635 Transcript_22801/m.77635 type:complete len:373 (+) Transcript_22801:2773-3891(+)
MITHHLHQDRVNDLTIENIKSTSPIQVEFGRVRHPNTNPTDEWRLGGELEQGNVELGADFEVLDADREAEGCVEAEVAGPLPNEADDQLNVILSAVGGLPLAALGFHVRQLRRGDTDVARRDGDAAQGTWQVLAHLGHHNVGDGLLKDRSHEGPCLREDFVDPRDRWRKAQRIGGHLLLKHHQFTFEGLRNGLLHLCRQVVHRLPDRVRHELADMRPQEYNDVVHPAGLRVGVERAELEQLPLTSEHHRRSRVRGRRNRRRSRPLGDADRRPDRGLADLQHGPAGGHVEDVAGNGRATCRLLWNGNGGHRRGSCRGSTRRWLHTCDLRGGGCPDGAGRCHHRQPQLRPLLRVHGQLHCHGGRSAMGSGGMAP